MSYRLIALVSLALGNASAAESPKLTLPEAVRLALAQNHALKLARLKVDENEHKKTAARSNYFPEIKNQSTVAHTTAEENIEIPAGAFGVSPNIGHVPTRDILINQGNQTFVTSGDGCSTSHATNPHPPGESNRCIGNRCLAR